MTIKPVAAPPTQKRGVAAADPEQQDVVGVGVSVSGAGGGVGGVGGAEPTSSGIIMGQQSAGSVVSHLQRSVAIDGHGQSPQRRGDVFDDLARHRRSPHKSTRSKRREHHHDHAHAHHKRDRGEREKHTNAASAAGGGAKCSSPHGGNSGAGVSAVAGGVGALLATVSGCGGGGGIGLNSSGNQSPASGCGSVAGGGKSTPEHLAAAGVLLPAAVTPKLQQTAHAVSQAAANLLQAVEETYSGYNSGDEHLPATSSSSKESGAGEGIITPDEWQRRDDQFAKCMTERGYVLKPVEEDGACLFRSISLQIYGDEEMHDVIRQHTMDYIYKNREYFGHFVTEDINSYIKRKRRKDSHGNHIEIQAMSEIYSRPVEVYCYKSTPINIFNSEQLNNGYAPLRLSYQRGSHYNAIIDPYNATVGVGLGLAGYKPELQTKEATRLSEQLEIEQTMFEDKLKTTDWEATNEAIEEQIARESYLQWCRENCHKTRAVANTASSATTSSSTVTSADASTSASSASDAEASPSKYAIKRGGGGGSGSSTVTSAASPHDATAAAAAAATAATAENMPHEHVSLLTAKAHNPKKEADANDLSGYNSDDTDMSSTSSIGGGNASPTASRSSSAKKSQKTRCSGGGIAAASVRSNKKRRLRNETGAAAPGKRFAAAKDVDVSARKSPKRDAPTAASPPQMEQQLKRAQTPEAEQQPCTSKQSHTPERQRQQINEDEGNEKRTATAAAAAESDAADASAKKSPSNFYQELLEASYAAEDGELTESEMLQRAIRMSTQDYIEDQKRKYFFRP